jgi:hypothetical protein
MEKVKATRTDRWIWLCPCGQYNDEYDESEIVYCEECEKEFEADFEP